MKKLTLNADESIIEKAEMLAKEEGTSISAMFEGFILARIAIRRSKDRTVGPITQKATGIISLPRDKKAEQILEEALVEKYELEE